MSMDSSSPPMPFQDFDLISHSLLSPKVEAELEPPDEGSSIVRTGPNHNPNPDTIVIADLQTALDHLSSNPDDYEEWQRVAQLFLSFYDGEGSTAATKGESSTAIVVASEDAGASSSKNNKSRCKELHRVSYLNADGHNSSRDEVRRTRIMYECLRRHLIRQEKANPPLLGRRSRTDLHAASQMAKSYLWLYREKRIVGLIPGIHIGDVFFYRMELCVIGLHCQVQAGIDFLPGTRSPTGEPIATSIIISGGYEDDEDWGDVLVYTGRGGRGRNLLRHSFHQKLEGGNLALERSSHYGIEIRVIRGFKSDQSPTGKFYVYDGLYLVAKCWTDVGKSGFTVYKYKLMRLEGQGEMGSAKFKLAGDLKANLLSVKPVGYLSLDISEGKENFPVSLFNDVDDDKEPLLFYYLVSPVFPRLKLRKDGCQCVSDCSVDCYCARKNGGQFAFGESGILLRGKPLIYECGKSCQCPPSCVNRVSQKGMSKQLEVFRSRETGWGVRSLDFIRAGQFICEFSGIMLTKTKSEVVSRNGGSLIYPCRFPRRWAEWGDLSKVVEGCKTPEFPSLPELSFAIDVSSDRNAACYLSHSCNPNVFVQFVLTDHCDESYPHLMIFAMENIPPLRELSIDYGIEGDCG